MHEASTILIVDDEPAVRAALRRIVSRSGFRVLEAEGAADALEQIDAEGAPRPAAAILDYNMPDVAGVDLARALRKRLPDLPILLLSGGVADEEIQAALDEGVLWAYTGKPWNLQWLRDAVSAMVSGAPPPPDALRPV